MINTQILLDNIKDDMEGQSWTSPSTSGTTSFVAVYTYPENAHDAGFPYLVVLDAPVGTTDSSDVDTEYTNSIQFQISANYAVVDGSTQADQRDTAMLRIREAYDFLREYISDDDNIAAWLTTPTSALRGSQPTLTWRREELTVEDQIIPELNLFRRIVTLPINDLVYIT